MKKKTNYFFEQFVVLSQFCNRAIDALIEGMKPVKDIDVEALKNSVHTIEHAEAIGLGTRKYNLVSIDK